MKVENWKIERLKPYDKNPRRNDGAVEAVAASIKEFGFRQPILVDRDGVIVTGHTRWKAAKSLGMKTVPVMVATDLTPDQVRAYRIADNHLGEIAEWDDELLTAELEALKADDFNLDLLGFDEDELARLLGEDPDAPDPDAVPEPPKKARSRRSDLWILGDHRLLCGDSTQPEDVKRLMGKERADVCFTSPPYAEQRKEQYGGIAEEQYLGWFATVQKQIVSVLGPRGSFVLNIKAHARDAQRSLYVMDLVSAMVRAHGWLLVDEFCWLRTGIPQQVVHRFKNAFEPCYWFVRRPDYAWWPTEVRHRSDAVPIALGPGAGDTKAARRQGTGVGAIHGNRVEPGMAFPSNVLDFKNNAEALGHPAAFPVRLPAFFIGCMSLENGTVYEPFAGSGTTIIAAEQLGRRCFAMEIEPIYCDVAVKRWETFTGKKARLEKNR